MDSSTAERPRGGRVLAGILALAVAALAARALDACDPGMRGWYAGLHAAYFVLFLAAWWPGLGARLVCVVFTVQCVIVVTLLSFQPELDFITALLVPLCYQAVVVLAGRLRWFWIAVFVALIGGSLAFFLGPLRGLALGLTSMAIGIVLPAAYVAASEIVAARTRSRSTLAELQATNERLQAYAEQVAELAVVEERNRLERELQDSVSQTMFSILLTAQSVRLLLDRDAGQARTQMDELQRLTQDALAQMRSLIAQLRPQTSGR